MDRFEAATVVRVPPATAFEFLLDFPGYADYSPYLESVDPLGDGTTGTVYELTVAWRMLSLAVRSKVTEVRPPARIDWQLVNTLDARGAWVVEPVDGGGTGGEADADEPAASRVRLQIRYRPDSAGGIDIPGPFSIDSLVDRLEGLARAEAERTVERIVADLEGEPRPVDVRVRTGDAVPEFESIEESDESDDGEEGGE